MELNTTEIKSLIGLSRQAMYKHIQAGRLQGFQRGAKGVWHVPMDDFLRFVEKYNYKLNEEVLKELQENK